MTVPSFIALAQQLRRRYDCCYYDPESQKLNIPLFGMNYALVIGTMRSRRLSVSSSREFQLLLCCARTHPNAASRQRFNALIGQNLAWDEVLRLAEYHRLLPLLHCHLQTVPPGAVPAAVHLALQNRRHAGLLREHILIDTLHSLLSQLEAQGITAIPYKGPAFAAQVYGAPALRPCSDLDLLVQPHQVYLVKTLLLAQGFQMQHCFADAKEEAAHLQTDCELNFVRPQDRLLVEVHWRFRPQSFPFPIDLKALWSRRQMILLSGTPVPTLPMEDYLLLLCVHGAKHCWERLIWVCDIAEILRVCPDLPWARIIAEAERLGCGRVLRLGLMLARDLLDAPVPDHALRGTPLAVRALAGQVHRQICGQGQILPPFLSRPLFHVAVRERLRDQTPYWKDRARREADRLQQKWFRKRPA